MEKEPKFENPVAKEGGSTPEQEERAEQARAIASTLKEIKKISPEHEGMNAFEDIAKKAIEEAVSGDTETAGGRLEFLKEEKERLITLKEEEGQNQEAVKKETGKEAEEISKEERIDLAKEFGKKTREILDKVDMADLKFGFLGKDSGEIALAHELSDEVGNEAISGNRDEAELKLRQLEGVWDRISVEINDETISDIEKSVFGKVTNDIFILREKVDISIFYMGDYPKFEKKGEQLVDWMMSRRNKIFNEMKEGNTSSSDRGIDARKALKEISDDIKQLLSLDKEELIEYIENFEHPK